MIIEKLAQIVLASQQSISKHTKEMIYSFSCPLQLSTINDNVFECLIFNFWELEKTKIYKFGLIKTFSKSQDDARDIHIECSKQFK